MSSESDGLYVAFQAPHIYREHHVLNSIKCKSNPTSPLVGYVYSTESHRSREVVLTRSGCPTGNHVPLGSIWVGDLDWVGCAAHRSTRLSVVITRAWKDAFLPSVQKIAATLVFTWVEGGRTRTNTEQVEGRYNFASHAFQLKADPSGHVSADITCSFTDDKHCHAVIFQASTNTLCGRATLNRT